MNLVSETPTAFVAEITPALASRMLATSPGNRKISDWYIDHLAAAMRRGEWQVTSQGIGFNTRGQLRDAHHRLNAVIRSNVTIKSVVVLGMSDSAYGVTDIGMKRNYGDRLDLNRHVAEVCRQGCAYYLNDNRPTINQMQTIIECGLRHAAQIIQDTCGTATKYFSSCSFRLGAATLILEGADRSYILNQYRALCLCQIDEMTPASRAVLQQYNRGNADSTDKIDTLARALRVLDSKRSTVTKIQISDDDRTDAVARVRRAIGNSLNRHGVKVAS